MSDKLKNILQSVLFSAALCVLTLCCLFMPKKSYSDSERRALDAFPKLSVSSVLNGKFMTEFEDFSADQFPFRDSFRKLKAVTSKYIFSQLDNNDIYIKDDMACKIEYPVNEKSLSYASEKFRYIFDSYLKDTHCKSYLSIIPDKNAFLAKDADRLFMDYDFIYDYFEKNNSFAEFIRIDHLLSSEDYYATDTHWRQEKIVDVSVLLAEKMGVKLSGQYTVNTLENPFYGVYCGQSALSLKPDIIYYLTNDSINNCTVINHESSEKISMYDMKKAFGKDPYEMFLSGSLSLVTIEKPDANTNKELIVFRDSFGSSIIPLLSEGYKKITAVDIRYLPSAVLSRHIDFDSQDVLFLYSTLILNNSNSIK